MDILPVELVRLVFQYCDPPAVKALRLASGRYADVGYEFLLNSHFTAVEWRDDVSRLRSVAGHDRLHGSIRSLTFNFSRVDEYNARHTSFFQHWLQEPEERSALLQDAWLRYYELEAAARELPPLHTRSATVEECFKRLPNLKHLDITLTQCPYDIELLQEVFTVRSCRKRDRQQARKNLNALVSAARHARLTSLSIDQLPLEVFRQADDRRHWFDCARSPCFAGLTHLHLALDPPPNLLPAARLRAVNGLGHVLQHCPNLTHLTLAFHTYHAPLEKFPLNFQALFGNHQGGFTYHRLTDLKLEGVSCAEDDLRVFLLRHAATLERLRLGGRGLARPGEWSTGGVHLHAGSFRSLLTSLRGRLPRLARFHMEGDAQAGDYMASSREAYVFRAVSDDEWNPIGKDALGGGGAAGEGRRRGARGTAEGSPCVKTVDCLGLERFLVKGGEYPRLLGKEAVGAGEIQVQVQVVSADPTQTTAPALISLM